MLGIYFSGTGNTRYAVDYFVSKLDGNAKSLAIESENIINQIQQNEFIVFGYPIYFSNVPIIVRDFILNNKDAFKGKKIFIIATMGLFSGDGTGCGARLLKKCGAVVNGGIHLRMPDVIADEKVLKKSIEKNRELVKKSEIKMDKAIFLIGERRLPKQGLSFFSRIVGLIGQRLWFYNKTKSYSDKLKINSAKCVGCGLCAKNCPMQNIDMRGALASSSNKCAMCYRCVNNCPKQAITLLGKKVIEQTKIEKYL